ncbi:methionyl-tRNA formyltransferase [Streptomyces mobaraensis]|uniref:methionyl-tRNA formyltransferase n=1 Tax=Streptomyces mobaraensis TaxID=35621 RepID=UPI0033D60661
MSPAPAWRVAVVAALPQTAPPLVEAVRRLGHTVPVVIGWRRPRAWPGHLLGEHDLPSGVDLVLPHTTAAVGGLLRAYAVDMAVSYGYPRRLPADAVHAPRHGIANCHPSALPAYRGPNPVGWAVRDGREAIGVTWHRMDEELDNGTVLAAAGMPLLSEDWSFTHVNDRVLSVALPLLPTVLDRLAADDPGDAQTGGPPSWAGFFEADYATIDWTRPAHQVHDQVRAWNIAGHHPRLDGPVGVIEGRPWKVRRTSLTAPGHGVGRRVECADGPVWVTAADQLTVR